MKHYRYCWSFLCVYLVKMKGPKNNLTIKNLTFCKILGIVDFFSLLKLFLIFITILNSHMKIYLVFISQQNAKVARKKNIFLSMHKKSAKRFRRLRNKIATFVFAFLFFCGLSQSRSFTSV